ncbi:MAG: MFS transporter, partial [Rhodothermales bacterium]
MNKPDAPDRRRAIAAWATYDFANSAFTTLVVTFIFATYFTDAIAENDVVGTELWSRGIGLSQILVALLSPYLGAMADRGGYRKRFLLLTTMICVVATALLYFAGPGDVMFALVIFVIGNVAFELANVFYNAFLPDIAAPHRIGRISGYGWALGYVGGLFCLLAGFYLFVAPETPPFGLSKASGEHVRATNLLVAAWFGLFSIPLFATLRERRPSRQPQVGNVVRSATREIIRTFKEIRSYRDIFWLLLARLVYNDGLVTIFAFGGIYAVGTFGFTTEDIFLFGIVLNVAAGLGAYAFGFVDDRLGGRTTIFISLACLLVAALGAVMASSRGVFWAAAILVGLSAGPNQSASRSLMGRFIPLDKENEFFGFFAFSGKATAFLGPVLLGIVTGLFDSQRAGMSVVILFFVAGALLLFRVDEKRGSTRADRAVVLTGPPV